MLNKIIITHCVVNYFKRYINSLVFLYMGRPGLGRCGLLWAWLSFSKKQSEGLQVKTVKKCQAFIPTRRGFKRCQPGRAKAFTGLDESGFILHHCHQDLDSIRMCLESLERDYKVKNTLSSFITQTDRIATVNNHAL